MARDINDLLPLQAYPDWYRTEGKPGVALCTDGYSDIFRVFKAW
jgi:hypothetical protein